MRDSKIQSIVAGAEWLIGLLSLSEEMAFIQIDAKWLMRGHIRNTLRENSGSSRLEDPAEKIE
ncbi:MAG: hypothetical protein KAU46_13395 [Candidatus Aminicenantes bacterium]|nr:hypothetical protein [Candidatus Aminicenantes bacterium]